MSDGGTRLYLKKKIRLLFKCIGKNLSITHTVCNVYLWTVRENSTKYVPLWKSFLHSLKGNNHRLYEKKTFLNNQILQEPFNSIYVYFLFIYLFTIILTYYLFIHDNSGIRIRHITFEHNT